MRQMISGLVAAAAVMTVGATPASACGWGGCCGWSPCAQTAYVPTTTYVPVTTYAPTTYWGCATGCGGWGFERLAEPTRQYYYVNQGPTYSGPGSFAPYPAYEENALPTYHYRWHHHYYHRPWHYAHRRYGYPLRRYY